jgi:hypothetical protein
VDDQELVSATMLKSDPKLASIHIVGILKCLEDALERIGTKRLGSALRPPETLLY